MEFPPPPRHRAKPLPQASHSPAAPKGAAPLTKSQGLPPPLRGFHHRAGLPSPRDHTRLLIGGAGGFWGPPLGWIGRLGRAPGVGGRLPKNARGNQNPGPAFSSFKWTPISRGRPRPCV